MIADAQEGIRTLETGHLPNYHVFTGWDRTVFPAAVPPSHFLRVEERGDLQMPVTGGAVARNASYGCVDRYPLLIRRNEASALSLAVAWSTIGSG